MNKEKNIREKKEWLKPELKVLNVNSQTTGGKGNNQEVFKQDGSLFIQGSYQ